jgi:ABC-type multidrug transport system fused ATPase/permease subunit
MNAKDDMQSISTEFDPPHPPAKGSRGVTKEHEPDTGRAPPMGSPFGNIEVRGARENNLRNISLDIPRRQITVFTGISGSGKSSLVFDTIAAESQRLINETFSTGHGTGRGKRRGEGRL